MRLVAPFLLSLLLLAPVAAAQDATQDLRLRVVSNDVTAGGQLILAVEARTSEERGLASSLGSGTIDVRYDDATLTVLGIVGGASGEPGYTVTQNSNPCNDIGGTCVRIGITSGNIGIGFGQPGGYDVGRAYTLLTTIGFSIGAGGADDASFVVDRSALSIGYYDTPDNGGFGGDVDVIEDNTKTVGDDYIAFDLIEDVSVRTATLDAGEEWYLVGMPGAGATLDAFAAPFWTQGFAGSDAGTTGSSNVIFWSETTRGFVAPTDQSTLVPAGAGLFFFAYADDDNDGTDEAFPKTTTLSADALNGQPSPVNNTAPDPNPYEADLPFTFSTTFTDTSTPADDGWNLLSNPTDDTVDWDDAGWTRTNMSTVLYTWDPDNAGGAQYVDWSPGAGTGSRGNGTLVPFEGFWSQATAASPVLTMPAEAYGPFVPAAPREAGTVPAVRLRVAGDVSGQPLANEAFVAFLEGAEAGLDAHDAYELAGFGTDRELHLFTTLETGETLSTDVRPPLDDAGIEVALDVSAIAAGAAEADSFTLTWPELRGLDASTPVQLVDLEARQIVDLWTTSEYTFSFTPSTAGAGEAASTPVLQAPQTEAARTASDGARFALFVGSEAQLPVSNVDEAVLEFGLRAPAPNPSQGRTQLRYTLEASGEARLAVYDMLGRAVAVAATGLHTAGVHDVSIDTRDLAPGLYVLRLEADGRAATQSLTVVR